MKTLIPLIILCCFSSSSLAEEIDCGSDPVEALYKHIQAHINVDASFISQCTSIKSIREFNYSDLARAVPISNEDRKSLFNLSKDELAEQHDASEIAARDFFRRFYLVYWEKNKQHIKHDDGMPFVVGKLEENQFTHVLYRYKKHIGKPFRFKPIVVSFVKEGEQFIMVDDYLFSP